MGLPADMREEHLCLAWQRGLLDPSRARTDGGELLHVVYPGRRCGDPGPDFRDAVLALPDATLLHGDVEVHLRQEGWQEHGHASNPAYDRVILHLTWGGGGDTCTSAGTPVRALALASCLAIHPEALVALPARRALPLGPTCPVALAGLEVTQLPSFFHRLGQVRLERQAVLLSGEMALSGLDQALWTALLRGLGYRRNTAPFVQLSQVVPWATLAHLADRPDGGCQVQALLLGAAGFLEPPSVPLPAADEARRREWQARFEALRPRCAEAVLHRVAWTLAGVRPENAPARRVAAAAGLALAYREGPGAALRAECLATDLPFHLRSTDDAFWQVHADFGRGVGPRSLALLGSAREAELLVNAVLPALLALAWQEHDATLEAAVRQRYAAQPGSGGNQLTRHMLQTIGAPPRVARTAAAEQGLLQLYHAWCRERRCWECPLPAAFGAATMTAAADEGRKHEA